MIIEDYVSFETAKLLKEKGYKGSFDGYYNDAGCVVNRPNVFLKEPKYQYYERVSLYMAMKWLREAYNILIEPESVWNGKKWEYQLFVVTPQNAASPYYEHNTYKSYEECVEAGIKYCLEKKLIF